MAEIVTMPKLGFDMAEGTLVRWVVAEGEPVAKGAVLAEIETDKATVEVESTFEGVVARHLVTEGTVVPVNTPIAVVSAPGEAVDFDALLGAGAPQAAAPETGAPIERAPAAQVMDEAQPPEPAAPELMQFPAGVRVSPLARRMAEENGINLRQVQGTGPDGRITKKDIQAYLAAPRAVPAPAVIPAAPAAPTPAPAPVPPIAYTPGAPIPDTVVPLNRLRGAVGRRMVESKQQVPHFYVTHEYEMAALLELRKQVNALLPDDQKISVNDFIVKAAALTLREFPNLNASLDEEKNSIVRHGQVNVGVAVAVEGGLLTVVSRDTDRKPLRLLADEIRTMVARARVGKVRPDDIEGSTFSVSNLGMYDVEHFIAIINPPEAAILAVGTAHEVPVVKDGQVVPGLRMKATISVDHRVSDGVEAAQFLQAMAKFIEEPLRLLV
jgi:pyruvate dehydrogenase E2 component (dihydrolipoamide acetyltransferase)